MAPRVEGKRTDLSGLASAFAAGIRGAVNGFRNARAGEEVLPAGDVEQHGFGPGTPFSPGEPIMPWYPEGADPWAYQFQAGANLVTQPRSDHVTPFFTLRQMAEQHDLIRIMIETRKEQMSGLKWELVAADEEDKNNYSVEAKAVTQFLKKPNKVETWYDWLGQLLEDVLVIDAATIYRRRTRGGQLYALDIVDGATIKPLIDECGRVPIPPLPAYQQVVYGFPRGDYRLDEILYKPKNRRSWTPYGFSPVEYVLVVINLALRRELHYLAYYTDGTLPDAGLYEVPENWSMEEITKYQRYFDLMLRGNSKKRHSLRFVPKGAYHATKDHTFEADFEEWVVRVICAAFGANPLPFVRQFNRATAEVQEVLQSDTGLDPMCIYVENLITQVVQEDLGFPMLKFQFKRKEKEDKAAETTRNTEYVKTGIYAIDDVLAKNGMDKRNVPPFVLTATGPIFLTPEYIEAAKLAQVQALQNQGAGGLLSGLAALTGGKPPAAAGEGGQEGNKGGGTGSPAGGQGEDGLDVNDLKSGGPVAAKPGRNLAEDQGQKKKEEKPAAGGEKKRGWPFDKSEKAVSAELRQWEQFTGDRLKKNRITRPFVTMAIPDLMAGWIRANLARATKPEHVKKVFLAARNFDRICVRLQPAAADLDVIKMAPSRSNWEDQFRRMLSGELDDWRDDFEDWLETFRDSSMSIQAQIQGYQFAGATFKDDFQTAVQDTMADGWTDGKAALDAAAGEELELAFSELKAGQWAADYAATRIKGIDDATKDMIAQTVSIATENGWDWQQLRDALVDGYQFSPQRAEVIARTESGTAYNTGAVNSWRESGLVEAVYVSDGDGCEACMAINGQTWTLDEALANPLEHPNCVREFYPIFTFSIGDAEAE